MAGRERSRSGRSDNLSNVGAMLSRAGSPGDIWVPESPQLQLPKNAKPGRTDFEDLSWLESDLDLDSPDALIEISAIAVIPD